jgi:hypothetical protein
MKRYTELFRADCHAPQEAGLAMTDEAKHCVIANHKTFLSSPGFMTGFYSKSSTFYFMRCGLAVMQIFLSLSVVTESNPRRLTV